MDQHTASDDSVDRIQRELRSWADAHIPNLHRAGHHSTLWYGVVSKCVSYVEALIGASTNRLLAAVGANGDAAVKLAGNGKPLDQFTLGQKMKLLQALEGPLRALMLQQPRLAVVACPLFGKAEVRLMDRVSRLRSDFSHERWPAEGSNELSIEFLQKATELCALPVIQLALELERGAA